MMEDAAAYGGLFAAAFVAATILPAQSEAVLAALLASGSFSPALLILAASIGNILGSAANWAIGRGIGRMGGDSFPARGTATLGRAKTWYRRFGRWTLLLSWLPIIGDPLTVVAGVLREPLRSFLVLVAVAKVGRYLAVAAAVAAWL